MTGVPFMSFQHPAKLHLLNNNNHAFCTDNPDLISLADRLITPCIPYLSMNVYLPLRCDVRGRFAMLTNEALTAAQRLPFVRLDCKPYSNGKKQGGHQCRRDYNHPRYPEEWRINLHQHDRAKHHRYYTCYRQESIAYDFYLCYEEYNTKYYKR